MRTEATVDSKAETVAAASRLRDALKLAKDAMIACSKAMTVAAAAANNLSDEMREIDGDELPPDVEV
jgi:hypothetical protein